MNGLGLPVEIVLTAGQSADVGQAKKLLADHAFEVAIGDKGYDSDELVEHVEARGAEAVIRPGRTGPSRANTTGTSTSNATSSSGSGTS